MITLWACTTWPLDVVRLNGGPFTSTSVMSSVTIRVPKFIACCFISSIKFGPVTACL
jgi:hypothetical protein